MADDAGKITLRWTPRPCNAWITSRCFHSSLNGKRAPGTPSLFRWLFLDFFFCSDYRRYATPRERISAASMESLCSPGNASFYAFSRPKRIYCYFLIDCS